MLKRCPPINWQGASSGRSSAGLPTRDAETIARAREELLAAERLKALCKKLGLQVPQEAIQSAVREVPHPEAEPLHFPSIQQQQQEAEMAAQAEPEKRPLEQEEEEADRSMARRGS